MKKNKQDKPVLDIAGNEYLIDIKEQVFIPLTPGVKQIKFGDFECELATFEYWGLYDLEKKEPVNITNDIVDYPPDHIVAVYIPADHDLDPNTFYSMHDHLKHMHEDNPIRRHVAVCMPTRESVLQVVIEDNRFRKEKIAKEASRKQSGKMPKKEKEIRKGNRRSKGR